MFKFGKKMVISAPVSGKLKKLEMVQDDVFSGKMLGEGFAIEPTEEAIYAPCPEGQIVSVFPTKHAISLLAKDGKEILIHIGLDTVELKGQGFDILVSAGDFVTKETLLAKVNFSELAQCGKITDVIVVYTNLEANHKLKIAEKIIVTAKESIGKI